MPRTPDAVPILPSVLDRLLGARGAVESGVFKSRTQIVRDVTQAVRRDLENLLNTRRRCGLVPAGLDELDVSLVTYGLPDFSQFNLQEPEERERLRLEIEDTIRAFEPRFKSVRVTLVGDTSHIERHLRFRIDALLRLQPEPQQVVFDSDLEPMSSTVEVKAHAT
ncbi:MAG: type VI secretion system baseplate subunit TssE [Pirellulaceae bacterium]|jgi:type VI secretion system protein ImpF|nr:type VI secretion system baseplate subunit TssE [Pirellulaceae bacterium]